MENSHKFISYKVFLIWPFISCGYHDVVWAAKSAKRNSKVCLYLLVCVDESSLASSANWVSAFGECFCRWPKRLEMNQNNRIKVSMGSELNLKNYKVGILKCYFTLPLTSWALLAPFLPSSWHSLFAVSVSTQECLLRLFVNDTSYHKRSPYIVRGLLSVWWCSVFVF